MSEKRQRAEIDEPKAIEVMKRRTKFQSRLSLSGLAIGGIKKVRRILF
jgi:hypothetical protein